MRARLWIAAIAMGAAAGGTAVAADGTAREREIADASKDAPIVVAPFTAVTKPAQQFGKYEPRKDTVYRQNEQMHFYAEPKNLAGPKNAQGLYNTSFVVDLEVSGGGQTLKQPGFASHNEDSRTRKQDVFLNLNVELSGAPPGKYNVKFTIRDRNSKKSATFAQDVTIK